MAKISLTIGEIRACIRQVLDADYDLTAEQRYALNSAIEMVTFIERISPAMGEAVKQLKAKLRN